MSSLDSRTSRAVSKPKEIRLAISLILILVLNAADLFFTLMILKSGTMKEGNPLAVFLYSRNPLYLICVKVFIAIFFVSLIWCLRRRVSPKIIGGSIIVVLVFYFILIAYHLQCLAIIPYFFS